MNLSNKLPPDILRYTRRFLSMRDVWGTQSLESDLQGIFEHTHPHQGSTPRILTRFPAYYHTIPLYTFHGMRWKRRVVGDPDHTLFRFSHRRQDEPFQYEIALSGDRACYTILFQPQWGEMSFNSAQIDLLQMYFTTTFPGVEYTVVESFAELIFVSEWADLRPPDPPTSYSIHESPRPIFAFLHNTVLKIKKDMKELNQTILITHDNGMVGPPWKSL